MTAVFQFLAIQAVEIFSYTQYLFCSQSYQPNSNGYDRIQIEVNLLFLMKQLSQLSCMISHTWFHSKIKLYSIQMSDLNLNKNDQSIEEITFKPINSSGKTSYLRDLMGIKTLMEKRSEQRNLALYYLTTKKDQSALIYSRQLMFSSLKIYKEYFDQYNQQFEQNFFFRTSKAKQHLEYLLDCLIACRIFLQGKKKQDAIDILQKVEINENQIEKSVKVETNADKILFNQKHQIQSKMCAVLLNFVQIAKGQKLFQYCQKFFQIYIRYVKNNYGVIEYSTAIFKYGNYLFEIKNFQSAEEAYKISAEIRQKNVINTCLVDSLINLSLCQRELAKYDEAIKNTKQAIQIYKDVKISDTGLDQYYLFLAKLYMEAAYFDQAYENFLKCYKYRQKFEGNHPGKVQVQLNLMLFFKVLKEVSERHKDMLDIDDKKILQQRRRQAVLVLQKMKQNILDRQQFAKYRDFKSSKFSYLKIVITKQFFDSLNSVQVIQLQNLLKKLPDLTYARGVTELAKCSFYDDKKSRDSLIESNPQLRRNSTRKSDASSRG